LSKYEEIKWNTLMKHTLDVFRNLNKKYAEALAGGGGDKE